MRSNSALLIGQFVGELPPQLSLLAGSNRASSPFDGRQWWADDAPRAQFLKQSGHQRRPLIGGERRRQQPRREFPIQPGGSMGEAPGHFQSQGRARGEFDLVWRNRRIASQRGSVAQRRRRIEQQGVAHLVEVSALENAENKV